MEDVRMSSSLPDASARRDPNHPVDQVLRIDRTFLLGFQHVLAMYAGAVAVPIIVGGALGLDAHFIAILVNADLLVCGVATLIQAAGVTTIFGARLPVVTGATFTAVPPMISIGSAYGLPAVYGSMIAAGVFGILIAGPFSRLVKYFPAVVAGTVITVLGLSLIGAGVGLIAGHDGSSPDFAKPSSLGIGALVILGIIVLQKYGPRYISQLAVFIALLIGTLALLPFGMVSFSTVSDASWLGFSQPFIFGAPTFPVAAIISMCTIVLITYTETTADLIAIGEIVDTKVERKTIAAGLRTDGLSFIFAGFFNSFPDSTYVQNIGLLKMTRVKSRWVVAASGVILIVLGFVPKIGAVVASIPGPVIGGAALLMFAMVAAFGIHMLRPVDMNDSGNSLIVTVGLAVGMMPVVVPNIYQNMPSWFQTIVGTPLTATVIVVFFLNLLFNARRRGDQLLPGSEPPPAAAIAGTTEYDAAADGAPAATRHAHRAEVD
jgi:NCS2 family nucleobase:cation symporter-2